MASADGPRVAVNPVTPGPVFALHFGMPEVGGLACGSSDINGSVTGTAEDWHTCR